MAEVQGALGPVLEHRTDTTEGVATVQLAGEIDLDGAGALTALLDDVLDEATSVVVDLEHVSFLDLRGVAALLTARKRHAAAGFVVRNPPRTFDTLTEQFPGLDGGLVVAREPVTA